MRLLGASGACSVGGPPPAGQSGFNHHPVIPACRPAYAGIVLRRNAIHVESPRDRSESASCHAQVP